MVVSKNNTSRFDWVDGLKAFAILGILLNHFVEEFGRGPWFSNPSYDWPSLPYRLSHIFPDGNNPLAIGFKFLGWLGDMGPGIFILLSGFALTLSQLKDEKTPGVFYRKRLIRIFPLYISVHILVLAFALLVNHPANLNMFSPKVFLSLLGLRFSDNLFFFLNPSWWFIWLIIQLYLVFPILYKVLKNKSLTYFIILTLLVTIVSRLAGILHLSYSNNLYYWTTGLFGGTRLFEFAAGMVMAKLFITKPNSIVTLVSNPTKFFIVSLLFYVVGFVCSWTYIGSLFSNMLITIGLSGIFYVFFKIMEPLKSFKKGLVFIGRNSFSVFLIHQPFMAFFGDHLHGIAKVVALLLILVLSFPLGLLIERIVNLLVKYFTENYNKIEPFLISRTIKIIIYLLTFLTILSSSISLIINHVINSYINILILLSTITLLIFLLTSYYKYRRIKNPVFIILFIICIVFYIILPREWMPLISIAFVLGFVLIKFFSIFLKPTTTLIVSVLLIFSLYIGVEKYLRIYKPIETNKWGEFPALQPNSRTVYSLIPSKTTNLRYNNYNYFLKTNSIGFTSHDVDLTKKDSSIYRIFIVGDAFSMPEGMAYSFSYPYLLEKELKESNLHKTIQLINGGVTGYGPNEMLAQINFYIDTIQPDLIINEFFINEFQEINLSAQQRLTNIGFFNKESKRIHFWGYSQMLFQYEKILRTFTGRVDNQYNYKKSLMNLYEKDSPYYSDTVVNKIDTYLNAVKTICKKSNSDYWLMYVPGQIEVSSAENMEFYPKNIDINDTNKFNLERSHAIIYALCKKHSINLLDTKELLKNSPTQPVYFEKSWHWNEEGHKLIAHMLAAKIITKMNDERK